MDHRTTGTTAAVDAGEVWDPGSDGTLGGSGGRPLLWSLAITAVILALAVAEIAARRSVPEFRIEGWGMVFLVAHIAPVVVRHRWPLAAALVSSLALIGYDLNGSSVITATGVPLLVLIYAAGAHPHPRPGSREGARSGWADPASRVAAVAIMIVVATVAILLPFWPAPIGAIGVPLILAGVYSVGLATRRHRQRAVELRELNLLLAEHREELVRRARDSERLRIARDLHDLVSHSLGHIVMAAAAGRAVAGGGAVAGGADRSVELFRSIEESGRQGLQELRRLLSALRPPPAAQGTTDPEPATHDDSTHRPGVADIAGLVDAAGRSGARVSLSLDGLALDSAPGSLPAGIDVSAYRVVQESLTNAAKHARPELIRVDLVNDRSQFVVRVTDSGPRPGGLPGWLPSPAADRHRPVGLVGMQERVSFFGGTLAAGPTTEGGWQVEAIFPLPEPEVQR